MWSRKKIHVLQILGFLLFDGLVLGQAWIHHRFVVKEAQYKRMCSKKKILTVNGQFPGPTLYVHRGDTINVEVYNKGKDNITIHWHGVKQPGNPWTDGPEYITQCPIKTGGKFIQKVIFSDEEGTIWWHAHSDWSRATVHGLIVIYPKEGTSYPFPKPHAEVPIILGEWWKMGIDELYVGLKRTGGNSIQSDAFTINGQPGDLYHCSKSGTFKVRFDYGKLYLLRILNAAMNELVHFAIANHLLTVVGTDGSYTKPFSIQYITISPGQTVDALLHADQVPGRYYMAGRAYFSNVLRPDFYDRTITTAIVEYNGLNHTAASKTPTLPYLPFYNDTFAFLNFSTSLRSLVDKDHPINVPLSITNSMIATISVNQNLCPPNVSKQRYCRAPNSTRFAASMNNISFVNSNSTNILEAYYNNIPGVYETRFPDFPPLVFNFTYEHAPLEYQRSSLGREVKLLDYNSTVELVFQGTNLATAIDHPIHLHGYSVYVVGIGLGNYNKHEDPLHYNLVDPPLRNTVAVPINGWLTIRFQANNPGVWLMHCHVDRHLTWGMNTVFIVKDGKCPEECMLPPPSYMPPC